jgi:DNA-binding transcriptional MerR regulator
MSEFVFETADHGLLAPPAHGSFNMVDVQLASELQKIPDQLAFKIGDVAELSGLKTYVLRYWETEFDQLKPKKSKHNQRVYSRKDVEMVLLIKKLLYRDRYSIEGARSALRKHRKELRHVDEVLDEAAEVAATLGVPESPEVTLPRDFFSHRIEGLLERIERLKSRFA